MIKPGDYVVLTGDKWGDESYSNTYKMCTLPRYSIQLTELREGKLKIKDTDWNAFEQDGWEVQRIQNYFEPGDVLEITYNSDVKSIRNLTKEGKMNNEDVKKPTHLTVDDLYLTAKTPACPSTRQSFIETFGFKVQLNDPKLKDWIIKKGLEKDVKDNLPDHYAVIFDSWQPEINEIVWVQASHEWVGRYVKKSYNQYGKDVYQINGQWGDIYWLELDQIKPISERDFQVGDCYWDSGLAIYGVCCNNISAENLNNHKDRYKLVISPAIPEVK